MSYVFANTFGLKIKKDNNTLVLGNGNQVSLTCVPSSTDVVGDDVEDIVEALYATMLGEFADVFQPLPSGLPPKHEMAQTIPLELDGNVVSFLVTNKTQGNNLGRLKK